MQVRRQKRGKQFIWHSSVETERQSKNRKVEGEMKNSWSVFRTGKLIPLPTEGRGYKRILELTRPKLDMG